MAQYGKPTYWDERYTKDPEPFDWYQRYSGVKDKLASYVKHSDLILQIGCGNSRLTEDMYDDGYHNMENIDISKVVIDQMRDKYKDRASGGMSFKVMNACHLDYPDEHFDCVLDKGTLDSILCGEGSTGNVAKMLSEVVRVLKPNGVFFMVSYGVSDNRLGYLVSDEYPWKVSVTSVAKPTVSANAVSDSKDANSVHYIYVAVKDAGAEK